MRLWSIHPENLDCKGLVALWRETLLAQKVLAGGTKGYRNHPQLDRFKAHPRPLDAMARYLHIIQADAGRRGYQFDENKILHQKARLSRFKIPVTRGQLEFERQHLFAKLAGRDPDLLTQLSPLVTLTIHPLFKAIDGDIEPWEKANV